MTKSFNILLSQSEIINAYKSNKFPNAHCLLWNQETDENVEILSTENDNSIATEYRKEIAIDGSTSIGLQENFTIT